MNFLFLSLASKNMYAWRFLTLVWLGLNLFTLHTYLIYSLELFGKALYWGVFVTQFLISLQTSFISDSDKDITWLNGWSYVLLVSFLCQTQLSSEFLGVTGDIMRYHNLTLDVIRLYPMTENGRKCLLTYLWSVLKR